MRFINARTSMLRRAIRNVEIFCYLSNGNDFQVKWMGGLHFQRFQVVIPLETQNVEKIHGSIFFHDQNRHKNSKQTAVKHTTIDIWRSNLPRT